MFHPPFPRKNSPNGSPLWKTPCRSAKHPWNPTSRNGSHHWKQVWKPARVPARLQMTWGSLKWSSSMIGVKRHLDVISDLIWLNSYIFNWWTIVFFVCKSKQESRKPIFHRKKTWFPKTHVPWITYEDPLGKPSPSGESESRGCPWPNGGVTWGFFEELNLGNLGIWIMVTCRM